MLVGVALGVAAWLAEVWLVGRPLMVLEVAVGENGHIAAVLSRGWGERHQEALYVSRTPRGRHLGVEEMAAEGLCLPWASWDIQLVRWTGGNVLRVEVRRRLEEFMKAPKQILFGNDMLVNIVYGG